MRRRIVWFVIIGSMFLISLFKGCSCNPTYHGTGYYAPAWSSDGTMIFYFRNDLTVEEHRGFLTGGYFEWKKNEWYICSCDLNGRNRKTIYKVGEFSDELPSELWRMIIDVSSDGKILYSATTAIKSGIWILDVDGSDDHQIISWGKNPRWAYNETKVVFEANGDKEGIWMMDRDGSNVLQVLTEGSSPAFCNNNQKILYHIWPAEGYGQLYCYSFSDSSIDTLIEGSWADWGKNGEGFVYKGYSSGRFNKVMKYIFQTSTSTKISEQTAFNVVRWSATDKVVYEGSILLVNSDGTNFKKILEDDLEHLWSD